MEFTKSLIKGNLIKRYKRFFVDAKLNDQVVTAHCPNTGSMKGLLDEGNEVYLPRSKFGSILRYDMPTSRIYIPGVYTLDRMNPS